MNEVSLTQILQAREQRAATQQKLLRRYEKPLICFTMNIPGPIKLTPLIARGFGLGKKLLSDALKEREISVLHEEAAEVFTGCEAFFVADATAETLKRICTEIEDSFPLGRLFDMDVLDVSGSKLTRDLVGGKSRNCIVCGTPGAGCASRRVHTVAQLQEATTNLLAQYFAQADASFYAQLATQSLLDEVHTTPKPGLVDKRNNGSHRDMNVATFETSAHALTPYFERCVRIGQQTARLSPAQTFPLLRQAGIEAEKAMYAATNGVNTHKGVIYSMGVLCGALGRLWKAENETISITELLAEGSLIVKESAAADLAEGGSTAGLTLYRTKGLSGIRGEVAAGLPSVANIGLPAFREALKDGLDRERAGTVALLHLIANVQDTNLYHRGGEEGAEFAKKSAAELLSKGMPATTQIEALDDAFIVRNLSPGGCADLLAITYFLDFLEHEKSPL